MIPTYSPKPLVWLLVAAVACFISIACATEKGSEQQESEPAKKSEEAAEPAEQDAKVYTNDDLNKLFGEAEAGEQTALPLEEYMGEEQEPVMEIKVVEPEPAKESVPDPVNLMEQQQAQVEERSRLAAEAEQAVADARARVTQLEKRLLALRNPFSARPEIPEDEKSEWDSMGTSERVTKSEEELQQAREDLTAAEKALAEVR
jgi:hypothetical protein